MHTENTESECLFWVRTLSALSEWQYAYLAKNCDDYFFVKKAWDSYIIKRIDTLTDSDISDRMRDDYDSHSAWVEAVQDWETDSSYYDWSQSVIVQTIMVVIVKSLVYCMIYDYGETKNMTMLIDFILTSDNLGHSMQMY